MEGGVNSTIMNYNSGISFITPAGMMNFISTCIYLVKIFFPNIFLDKS